jgi:hypothetical protein
MRWRRTPQVLWRTAPGYLALATVDGRITEVGGSGGDIWTHLAGWITEEELTATLARECGAEEAVVSADLHSLLHELHAQGYVERGD